MNILILNCGSSSLKFQLISTDIDKIERNADRRLAHGQIDQIGGTAITCFIAEGREPQRSALPIKNVRSGLDSVLGWIASENSGIGEITGLADINAVGHRVVHGGEHFTQNGICPRGDSAKDQYAWQYHAPMTCVAATVTALFGDPEPFGS